MKLQGRQLGHVWPLILVLSACSVEADLGAEEGPPTQFRTSQREGSSLVARGESVKPGGFSPMVDREARGALDFGAPTPSCARSPCTTGPALNGFCDWCVGLICSRDPFCCQNSWDARCVSEVATICGQRCDNRVCTAGQPFNAYATPCTGNVCSLDPFCCEQGWDSACVAAVPSRCGIQCP
jgi:hypothetical protein